MNGNVYVHIGKVGRYFKDTSTHPELIGWMMLLRDAEVIKTNISLLQVLRSEFGNCEFEEIF